MPDNRPLQSADQSAAIQAKLHDAKAFAYGDAVMQLSISAEVLASILDCDEQGNPRVTLQKAMGLAAWATKRQFNLSNSKGGPWMPKTSPAQDEAILLRWALHVSEKADAAGRHHGG